MNVARQLAIFAVITFWVIALVLSITLNYHFHNSTSAINQKLGAEVGRSLRHLAGPRSQSLPGMPPVAHIPSTLNSY